MIRRENSTRYERVIAGALLAVVGGAALGGCSASAGSANGPNTPPAATSTRPQSPAPTTKTAPDMLDVGKVRKQLEDVPAVVRRESRDVLRVAGEICNSAGCGDGYAGTTFGVKIRGRVYEVTAGHTEKQPGITCSDQYLEGRSDGRTFSDPVINRAGRYKLEPGSPDSPDYSVPDLGMLQPAPLSALNKVGTLPLAPSQTYLKAGQVVYAVGYHPDRREADNYISPPPAHPALRRRPNIIGGVVLGPVAGSVGATQIIEVMGNVVKGDSGGPLMTPSGTVKGVITSVELSNSSGPLVLTAAEVEQDTGLRLVDYPQGQRFQFLNVQDVNTGSAVQLASSMLARPDCSGIRG